MELAQQQNASASFADLEANGAPSTPLDFPPPVLGEGIRVDASVLNPSTQENLYVRNVVFENRPDGRPPERAYWIGRKLRECIYGCVKECVILRFRNDPLVAWEATPERAVCKIMQWEKIRNNTNFAEHPLREISALQHINSVGEHPNVCRVLDVLSDEDYLMMFMPHYGPGELLEHVQNAPNGCFSEDAARHWFLQILEGLSHLHNSGVAHRDVSLENILVDESSFSVIIDLGMCLRVPYHDVATGGVTDASAGTLRRLVTPLVPCGKLQYIAPEILRNEEPFDGFAIDLWAAGVILFIFLVGSPPWHIPSIDDPWYRMIQNGELSNLIQHRNRQMSLLAIDLLQNMLKEDPRQRLSLMEIKAHGWIAGEEPGDRELEPMEVEEWRLNF